MSLRPLNQFIPYEHSKMEGILMLRDLLRKGDFMVKIDLRYAYFTVPTRINNKNFRGFFGKKHCTSLAAYSSGSQVHPESSQNV